MVLKLSKQVWVAHSTSRMVTGLVTCRHTVAFPEKYPKNYQFTLFTLVWYHLQYVSSQSPDVHWMYVESVDQSI